MIVFVYPGHGLPSHDIPVKTGWRIRHSFFSIITTTPAGGLNLQLTTPTRLKGKIENLSKEKFKYYHLFENYKCSWEFRGKIVANKARKGGSPGTKISIGYPLGVAADGSDATCEQAQSSPRILQKILNNVNQCSVGDIPLF
jgi:hypothetical protein